MWHGSSVTGLGAWACAQGWENFRKEFKQLRRSFRYNEYQEIREASPPTGFVSQVRHRYRCFQAQSHASSGVVLARGHLRAPRMAGSPADVYNS